MTDVRTFDCPAPDCSETFGAIAELTSHVNSAHAGEFQRDDWPDTPAGRAAREPEQNDDEE